MAKENNNSFALLSLVAIVAVVGVISLVMMVNTGGSAQMTPQTQVDENLVGDAKQTTASLSRITDDGGDVVGCTCGQYDYSILAEGECSGSCCITTEGNNVLLQQGACSSSGAGITAELTPIKQPHALMKSR
ncbi:MAG: hypothetical protein ACQESC_01085 [Nanobdellota archaeon]